MIFVYSMNLPITESILRGELRPNILQEYLDQDGLKQLIRDARQLIHKSQLIELEAIINKVLNGLVDTKDIYYYLQNGDINYD